MRTSIGLDPTTLAAILCTSATLIPRKSPAACDSEALRTRRKVAHATETRPKPPEICAAKKLAYVFSWSDSSGRGFYMVCNTYRFSLDGATRRRNGCPRESLPETGAKPSRQSNPPPHPRRSSRLPQGGNIAPQNSSEIEDNTDSTPECSCTPKRARMTPQTRRLRLGGSCSLRCSHRPLRSPALHPHLSTSPRDRGLSSSTMPATPHRSTCRNRWVGAWPCSTTMVTGGWISFS